MGGGEGADGLVFLGKSKSYAVGSISLRFFTDIACSCAMIFHFLMVTIKPRDWGWMLLGMDQQKKSQMEEEGWSRAKRTWMYVVL